MQSESDIVEQRIAVNWEKFLTVNTILIWVHVNSKGLRFAIITN